MYSVELPMIHFIHSQQLRACAEPRRTSAHRGEAPLAFPGIATTREIGRAFAQSGGNDLCKYQVVVALGQGVQHYCFPITVVTVL